MPRYSISSKYQGSLEGDFPSNFGALGVSQSGIWIGCAIGSGRFCRGLVGGLIGLAGSIGIGLDKVGRGQKTGDKTDEIKEEEVRRGENWSE